VYRDFIAIIRMNGKMLQVNGFLNKEAYVLGCAGVDSRAVEMFEEMFNRTLENSNFYQGKSLKIGDSFIEFIRTPSLSMNDVVLSDKIKKEYDLNVIRFLTDPRMHKITLRRGILLYGPPGTGKTSSVRGLFHELLKKKVTAVHLNNEAINKNRLTQIFNFISTYLAPCLVVMEDIDLIAGDRDMNVSAYIGTLLNILNGVEDQTKPVVVLGTTNRVNVLDAAVTRPCRFDRKIHIDYPTSDELRQIFIKASGIEPPADAIRQPEKATKKLTGAHIEEIVNTAKMLAVDRNCKVEICVRDAVKIVTEDFVIIHPSDKRSSIGFDEDDFGKDGCKCDPDMSDK
jgi:SpoVK/Ycf46/Vps4 family AAA+-type ATPase